jgi:hypothetical protein
MQPWLLITLSILGILLLPISICCGLESSYLTQLLSCLAAWSVLLLINKLAVFYYMDKTMPRATSRLWAASSDGIVFTS